MNSLVVYLVGCVGLIIKPGPDLLCTISTALSHGRARAVCLMGGLVLGCWLWIALLALGVAAFLQAHAAVMSVIRYGGMAYIGVLALGSLAEAVRGFRVPAACAFSGPRARGLRLVGRGVLMAMGNPLTIMFFLAFLPHFATPDARFPPSVQILLLGMLFCALVPVIYFPIICAAAALKSRLERSPRVAPAIKLVSGLLLVTVVVLLAVS